MNETVKEILDTYNEEYILEAATNILRDKGYPLGQVLTNSEGAQYVKMLRPTNVGAEVFTLPLQHNIRR